MTNAEKNLKEWLDHSVDKVKNNVRVVTPEEVGQNFFLHISTNTGIRKFVPTIGHRQADSENRTIPRICVAPSILGCLIGYSAIEYDFLSNQDDWKGGWKIYALPFEAALKPTSKLVYDSRHSDEHWLVAFNKETAEYIPETAGRIFYRSISYVARSGKVPAGEGTLYIEITKPEGFPFSKQYFLTKGYWKIEGPCPDYVRNWEDDKLFKVTELSQSEFRAVKNESAALLGMTDKIPTWVKWAT
jgi:hypothetical protein